MNHSKKWGMIILSSILFFISIGLIQTDIISDIYNNSLSANTDNANSAIPYSDDGIDREPGGRKITQLSRTTVLIENGDVFNWGDNSKGYLGVGDTISRSYPVKAQIENVMEIQSNRYANIVKTYDGELYGWGFNSHGMFSDGTRNNRIVPGKIEFEKPFNKYKFVGVNLFLMLDNGDIYGSGDNFTGLLGKNGKGVDSGTEKYNDFTLVEYKNDSDNALLKDVNNIVGGPEFVFFLNTKGQVMSYGAFIGNSRANNGANKNHSFDCKSPGSVNGTGQCRTKSMVYTKESLDLDSTNHNIDNVNKIEFENRFTMDGFWLTSLALKNNGDVFAWGSNEQGSLGNGGTTSYYYAAPVKGIDGDGYLSNGKDVAALLDTSMVALNDGRVVGFGENLNKMISNSATSNFYYPTVLLAGNQNINKNAEFLYADDVEVKEDTVLVKTEFNQVFTKGASEYNLGLNTIKDTPDFTKVIIPIKPIVSTTKLDTDNKELIDDPSTTNIDESKYSNTVDENGKITKWDKYNSSISLSVKREGMLKDDGVNETAIDYGDMKYEYCELEYNDKKEAVCKKDDNGKEVWVSPSDTLLSKRTAYPDVDDVELVDVNNTRDDPSDDVYQVKEHDITVDLNSPGSPQKAFRKYRFYYEEVRERYDTENSDFDPYSYYIVDLDRGDPEVHYLNLKENTNQEILDTDGTYMKLLDQQILRDEQYFGHGIRIYLPEHAKAYVVIEKTKNGKKQDETIPGFGDPVIPVLVEGQAPIAGVNFNDFFPQTVGNGHYRIYYINEYGNDVTLHFRISHDRDRPLILPNDNDSGGGDWKEELFNDNGDKIGEKQHYGGVYIVDMDTADPTKWDASTKTPVKNYKDIAGDMIYAIEGTQGTYTSDATPDRPKTIENNEVINHAWIKHSLWLTVTGQDVIKTTSTLDSLRLYKLDEEGNRIQPADSVVNFDEGSVSQIKNNYAIPVKENGNYELVLQDFAGNENVSQGNEARGVFFTVNFIDTKAPVVKEPLKVRDPDTNELNITLDADDGNGSGVVKDDPASNTYGIYYQFVKDGDDPTNTNWLPYVQDEDDPDHILHVPNKNFIGKLYVKVSDNAGNIAGAYDSANNFKKMISFDIADDSDAPAITYLGGNPASWQNTDVVVSFKASDNIAIEKVELVSLTDGTIIDTLEPKYENKVYSECKSENHNCAINGNDISFSYTISKNDTYQVIAYDMAGNKTTAIIDSKKPDPDDQTLDVKYIDKDQPTVELSRTKKGELKLIALDALSGIKTSGTPSNLVYDGMEYLILKDSEISNWNDTSITTRTDWKVYDPSKLPDVNTFDCYVYVRITDQAGNVLIKRSDLFTVSDLQPPVYVSSREATSSTYRRGVNQAVKVSVNFKDNIGLKEVEVRVDPNSVQGGVLTDVNGTTITEYKKSDYKNTKDDWFDFYVKQNGDYQVRATDENGNVSDWTDLEVSMIDQIEPTMTVSVNNGKFKVENVNGTISDIAKVYNDKGSLVDDISYQFVKTGDSIEDSDDTFISVGEEVSIPKGFTGTLYIKTYDEAKLQFDPLSKGNVKIIKKAFEKAEPSDTEPPTLVEVLNNPTKWQNADANLTLKITDNESGIVRVSVKDQLSGVILFHKTDFSEKELNVTVSDIIIKSNGTYIVEMEDAVGNISDNAFKANIIEVTKIDKRKPVIEHISWTKDGNILFPTNDLKADISDYDEPKEDNSSIIQYKYAFVKKGENTPDPDTWQVISKDEVDQLLKTKQSFVGKLVLRAIDAAGNESETLTANVGQETGKDSKPIIEVIQGDQEPWRKAGEEMELIVRVKEPLYGITHIEVMDHANGLSSAYAPYDHNEPDYEWHEYKFKVIENGMYTIKAVNANEDSATLPIYVSHFDTTAPLITSIEWLKHSDHATIHANDPLPGSGLNTIYYQLVDEGHTMDEKTWQSLAQGSNSIPIDQNFKGSIYAKACDAVGNCSGVSIQSLYLSNGEQESDLPVVTIKQVNDVKNSEDANVDINVSDETSGVKYFTINGPGVIGNTHINVPEDQKNSYDYSIDVNKNGTYTILAYDYAGNVSETKTFTIEHLKEKGMCVIGVLPELNIDSDGNGIPDLNLDPFDTGLPSINVDLNCDNIPDVNIDNNGDGLADLNIDQNDGIPYKNLITLYSWKPNKDFTLKNGYHYETMTDLVATNTGANNQNTQLDPNSGGTVSNPSVNGTYTNTSNRFTAPILGSMKEHPWWWILLLIISMITMKWVYQRSMIYYDERRIKKYMEDHNQDLF